MFLKQRHVESVCKGFDIYNYYRNYAALSITVVYNKVDIVS